MDISIFEFSEYRPYLLQVFGGKHQRKGLKSRAAEFLKCHTTLISQVLHGQVMLNLEQAEKLNRFLAHSDEESHFFILLVQRERAGSKDLKAYFTKQLEFMLRARQDLQKRVGKAEMISGEAELKYYSSWAYAAIHVAVTISEMSSSERIAQVLDIPLAQVRAVLEFLTATGLLRLQDGRYVMGSKHIHLGSDSSQIRNHHVNWRLKSAQSIDRDVKNNFHYSAAVTLAKKDVEKIKEMMIKNLRSINDVIKESKEEEVYAMNMDFFNLSR